LFRESLFVEMASNPRKSTPEDEVVQGPGVWPRRLSQVRVSPSQSPATVGDDVDPRLTAKISPDELLPGFVPAAEQLQAGLALTRRLAKFLSEAAGHCGKPAAEVRNCLVKMHTKYHEKRGDSTDNMHEHVAACFEAASALALMADQLAQFAEQVQKQVADPIVDFYKKADAQLETLVNVRDELCKETINNRVAIVKQRAVCLNQWNKLRLNLGIINMDQYKSNLKEVDMNATAPAHDHGATMDEKSRLEEKSRTEEKSKQEPPEAPALHPERSEARQSLGVTAMLKQQLSDIIAKQKNSKQKRAEQEFAADYSKTQEAFRRLEQLTHEANQEETLFRERKVPQLMLEMEKLELQRLEIIEVDLCKFAQIMLGFSVNLSNVSQKLAEQVSSIDRWKVMNTWTNKQVSLLPPAPDAADKFLVGLPCTSDEFKINESEEQFKPGEEMQKLLQMNFSELVCIRESKVHLKEHQTRLDLQDTLETIVAEVVFPQQPIPELRILKLSSRDLVRITVTDKVSPPKGPSAPLDASSCDWLVGFVLSTPNGEEGFIRADCLREVEIDERISLLHLLELPIGLARFADFLKSRDPRKAAMLEFFIAFRKQLTGEQRLGGMGINLSPNGPLRKLFQGVLEADWVQLSPELLDEITLTLEDGGNLQDSGVWNDTTTFSKQIGRIQKEITRVLHLEMRVFQATPSFDNFLNLVMKHRKVSFAHPLQFRVDASRPAVPVGLPRASVVSQHSPSVDTRYNDDDSKWVDESQYSVGDQFSVNDTVRYSIA
jgi:flagellar hook-basal body complex protein FliE